MGGFRKCWSNFTRQKGQEPVRVGNRARKMVDFHQIFVRTGAGTGAVTGSPLRTWWNVGRYGCRQKSRKLFFFHLKNGTGRTFVYGGRDGFSRKSQSPSRKRAHRTPTPARAWTQAHSRATVHVRDTFARSLPRSFYPHALTARSALVLGL